VGVRLRREAGRDRVWCSLELIAEVHC
jgi:hypothetical protein